MRMPTTKEEKKKRRIKQNQTGFEDVDDFGDLSMLVKKRKNKESQVSLDDLRNEKKRQKSEGYVW